MCVLEWSDPLLIMPLNLLLIHLIILIFSFVRILSCVSICSLESNRTDAIVAKGKVIAVFDASDFSIIETVELDVVLDSSDFKVDSLTNN